MSPTPSASSVPRPTADFSEPDHLVPASVMPRWIGYGIFSASRRLAAIVFGTLVDLIDTLKFVKSRPSISSTNSTPAVTRASTEFSRSSSWRCFGREPEFTPIRMGVPRLLASSATSATLSRPPMLPGLSRMQSAPASIALRASVWLKWMSAMTGIGDFLTITFRASMSLSRGTATRTMSAPASATAGSVPWWPRGLRSRSWSSSGRRRARRHRSARGRRGICCSRPLPKVYEAPVGTIGIGRDGP